MRTILIFFALFLCTGIYSFAQKKGQYLSATNPLVNIWQFDGLSEEAAPLIPDFTQEFFFPRADGDPESLMAQFEMDGFFVCPTYFTARVDEENLYLEIGESCSLLLSEEDKFVTVPYKMSMDGTQLQLTVGGKDYRYKLRF